MCYFQPCREESVWFESIPQSVRGGEGGSGVKPQLKIKVGGWETTHEMATSNLKAK